MEWLSLGKQRLDNGKVDHPLNISVLSPPCRFTHQDTISFNNKTFVTRFLTNGLFGKRRAWNGKAFREDNKGVNRFHAKSGGTECQHQFEYTIKESQIGVSQDPSVSLCYLKYQFPLSLWYTMTDEIRYVPVEDDNGSVQILIGFGSMAWSGGKLNASPFCLWRAEDAIQ